MRKRLASLFIGFVMGILCTVIFMKFCIYQPAVYELSKEIDLATIYPFQNPTPPVLGTLKPGTRYRVNFRKGIVDYVELATAFDRTKMTDASIMAQKARGLLTLPVVQRLMMWF